MNIWIFNHYAVTPKYPGGTRSFELGTKLCENGHKVTIFASHFNHLSFEAVDLPDGVDHKIEMIGKLRFIWVRTPSYSGNDLKRVRNMLRYNKVTRRLSTAMVENGDLENDYVLIIVDGPSKRMRKGMQDFYLAHPEIFENSLILFDDTNREKDMEVCEWFISQGFERVAEMNDDEKQFTVVRKENLIN